MKYLCFLLVICHGFYCLGGVVVQLDGKRAGSVFQREVSEGTNTWNETVFMSNQGFVLRGKDWVRSHEGGVMNSKGAEAGPLVFENAPDVRVKSIVMVVKSAATLRMRETLVCGESVLRLAGRPLNEMSGNVQGVIERGGVCEVQSWKIDMADGADVEAGKTQLVEVAFKERMKLSEIALGGDWGRTAWRRAWGGGFCEIIAFDEMPSDAVLAGTRNYLNVKWQLGLAAPSEYRFQRAAANAGVNTGSVFGTLFMVR